MLLLNVVSVTYRLVQIKTSRSCSKIQYDDCHAAYDLSKIQYDVCHAAYDRVNISVFRLFLKVSSDVDDVTVCDRLLHTRIAATGNERSPIYECLN